jgi:hypothetical protein
MSDKPHNRGSSIVGPFILIGLGIVLLLQQLDVIHWSLWEIIFRLWPLIIIAVGADVLIARRSFLAAAVSLLVVLGLLAGGLYLMGAGRAVSGEEIQTEDIAYPLEDAAAGAINLSLDSGRMEIGALADSSLNIVEGTLENAAGSGTSSVHQEGSKITVDLRREWPHRYFFSEEVDYLWNLDISPRIPLEFDLSLGAGQMKADLSGLKVSAVDVQIGAGQLILKLPAGGNLDVSVKIGAGDAEIFLPEGAMVDVDCTTAVGNCDLPGGSGLWSQSYTSSGYASAEYKITIQIDVAVGEGRVILG